MSSTHKIPYFFNPNTSSSTWERPAELTEGDVEELAGAHYLKQPEKIRASHLLIKHKDSRRPSSWKDVGGFSYN